MIFVPFINYNNILTTCNAIMYINHESCILITCSLVLNLSHWWWKVRKGLGFHTFTVNLSYFHIRKDRVGEVSPVYSKLWRCKALPSALVTVWRVMENKIATRVNLKRRGVVVENLVCGLCGKVEESSCHLFSASIPGGCGVFVLSGLECRLLFTRTLW